MWETSLCGSLWAGEEHATAGVSVRRGCPHLCLVPRCARDQLCKVALEAVCALEDSSGDTQKTTGAERFGVMSTGTWAGDALEDKPRWPLSARGMKK